MHGGTSKAAPPQEPTEKARRLGGEEARAATFLSISLLIMSDDKEVVGRQREAWVDEREADRRRA